MKKLIYFLLALSALLFANVAGAACSYDSGSGPAVIFTAPLIGGNITVGPDTPDGTIVYRQDIDPKYSIAYIKCSTQADFAKIHEIERAPLALSSWVGSPYPGNVYESGVPGLGVVVVRFNNQTFPTTESMSSICSNTKDCSEGWFGNGTTPGNYSLLQIIKIGAVTPGTIVGSNLPCWKTRMGQPTNNSWIDTAHGCFSGTLNVISRTCTTPDVYVPLGTHMISEFATRQTTDWKDASIKLTNCPVFHGIYPNTFNNLTWATNGTVTNKGTSPNTISLKLTPNTSIVDNANGVMDIDTSFSGAASGVGIQIASGTTSANTPFDLAGAQTMIMSSTQGTDISIPLVARYKMTAASVAQMRPGQANGKLTFTINYY